MSQDENNPRALAAKEVLNLDVDAKASIDIAVANDVIPNPPPWFFPQHVSFFPDKSLLYIGLFENHSDIFRAAPHKWRSLTDAHFAFFKCLCQSSSSMSSLLSHHPWPGTSRPSCTTSFSPTIGAEIYWLPDKGLWRE